MADAPLMNRRDFVAATAGASAALGLFRPLVNPAAAQAVAAQPNDPAKGTTIQVGLIGCGGQMNGYHITMLLNLAKAGKEDVKIAAVCDIYEPRLQYAADKTGGKPYHDYKELLKHPGLHAVHIATPDHWHYTMAVDALTAGLDVYLEKPVTYTWEEAKALRDLVKKTGRVLQVGVQSTSSGVWSKANELIKQGGIGKVVHTQGEFFRNSKDGEWNCHIPEEANEKNIDWEAFLGPCPNRPAFSKERFFRWRKYWDYSGGIATDLFYHRLGHLACALGPGEFPVRVVSGGGIWVQKDGRDVPDTFTTLVDYPSDHSVLLTATMCNRYAIEEVIRGSQATLVFPKDKNFFRVLPEDEFKDKIQERDVPEDWRRDHIQNFLQCIRSRQEPDCSIRIAYPVMVAIKMGVMSIQEQKVKRFDPATETMIA